MNLNKKKILAALFLTGFSVLLYEIYCVHVLFMFMVETTHATALAISSFLAGLGFSSLLFSRFGSKRILLYLQLAAAAYGYFFLSHFYLIPNYTDWVDRNFTGDIVLVFKAAVLWTYLFIPAFLIGGAFPILNGEYVRLSEDPTRAIGVAYFIDIAGSVMGALVAGYFLLPMLGLVQTVIFAVCLSLLLACFFVQPRRLYAICILMALVLYFKPSGGLKQVSATDQRFGEILYQKNSEYGLVTVGLDHGNNKNKNLFINYRQMCSSLDHESEAAMAEIAKPYLKQNSEILNIGLGCGFTAQAVLENKSVSKLTVAEINPMVIQAASIHYAAENPDVFHSSRIDLQLMDGAKLLRTSNKKFDAILIDIEEVKVLYSSVLYTQEYFEIMKTRLKEGGVIIVWSIFGSNELIKVLQNTMHTVFKNTDFTIFSSDLIMLASDSLVKIDFKSDAQLKQIKERVEKLNLSETNTINQRNLEKYINLSAEFGLPRDYREPFINK